MPRKPEDPSLTVSCETCGVAAGKPCVYTDGAFKGTKKLSGSHGGGMPERLLTSAEAAARLSTTPGHVREMARRRDLPSVRVGRLVRFDPRPGNVHRGEHCSARAMTAGGFLVAVEDAVAVSIPDLPGKWVDRFAHANRQQCKENLS